MGKKNKIARSFLMISQISITMLVPVFLCIFAGNWLNNTFSTVYFMPVFLFLGFGAAIRNVYYLTKSFYAEDRKKEHEKLAYIENLKRAVNETEKKERRQSKRRSRICRRES